MIQKVNQTPKSLSNTNMFSNSNSKGPSLVPIYSTDSPAHILLQNNSNDFMSMNRHNDMLKNSRSTKQATTLNSIRKPQLTNYAMNEANLGLKLGMNNTLFSDNNYDEEEFL
jgi:hypothetical protein